MPKAMTPHEFIAWEDAQPDKHEFNGCYILAMTGGSAAHSAIQSNVVIAVGIRLRGHPDAGALQIS